jgi:hypothetical protein
MLWPVRSKANQAIARTGQTRCYDGEGRPIPCENSGQDGEYRSGIVWPKPRFITNDSGVLDCLTGCRWSRCADLADGPVTWCEAIAAVTDLRRASDNAGWRLPNINELESLVDCAYAAPALSPDLPFTAVRDVYWSATTSHYEPDWSWALYLDKGAVGVGQKRFSRFHVWAVSS